MCWILILASNKLQRFQFINTHPGLPNTNRYYRDTLTHSHTHTHDTQMQFIWSFGALLTKSTVARHPKLCISCVWYGSWNVHGQNAMRRYPFGQICYFFSLSLCFAFQFWKRGFGLLSAFLRNLIWSRDTEQGVVKMEGENGKKNSSSNWVVIHKIQCTWFHPLN